MFLRWVLPVRLYLTISGSGEEVDIATVFGFEHADEEVRRLDEEYDRWEANDFRFVPSQAVENYEGSDIYLEGRDGTYFLNEDDEWELM